MWKELWHYIGWTAVNIGVPYMLPFVLFKLLQHWKLALTKEQIGRLRFTYLVKEAQLSLTSCAIATVALFELGSAHAEVRDSPGASVIWALLFLGVMINSLLFVLGTVIGNPPVEEAITGKTTFSDWKKLYPLGWASLWLGAVVSVLAFASHFLVYSAEHTSEKERRISPATPEKVSPASEPNR